MNASDDRDEKRLVAQDSKLDPAKATQRTIRPTSIDSAIKQLMEQQLQIAERNPGHDRGRGSDTVSVVKE